MANAVCSVQTQAYSPEAYEIIVVDNVSTDNTRAVVEQSHRPGLAPVKYVYEPQLGKSKARNTGVTVSVNEILAFIDDDAVADPNWLAGLAAAYEHEGEQLVGVAGKSEVVLEQRPSEWFPSELRPYLSGTEHLGNRRRLLAPGEYPILANFSVRRKPFVELGGFAESLTLYNEEIELCRRIRERKGEILYAPEAVVQHHVSQKRMTFRSLLQRAYWQGFADVLVENKFDPRSRSGLMRSNAALVAQMLSDGGRVSWALARSRRREAFSHLFTLFGRWGRFRAQFGLIFARPAPVRGFRRSPRRA